MKKYQKLTDDQLVELSISDDDQAYAEIVDRYEAPLRRYARGIVFNVQTAEDVTQETFIKAYVNLRSYKPGKKFSSWIYRIAHNESINHIRKHRRVVTMEDEGWIDRVVDDKASLDELLDKKFKKKVLQDALEKLKPKYRSPIILSALMGKSYEEISEILRIPISTVGTRINRGKRQLKALLSEKGS